MNYVILSIFPEMFDSFRENGIIRRAVQQNQISIATLDLRDFATDKHRVTDDRPYGGGCGMVMKPEPLAEGIRTARRLHPRCKTILLTPQGRIFNQQVARELAAGEGLIMVCGRYEGIDERICTNFIDDEISIGDFVLTGGEIAAMIIMDAVTRLLPNVLGSPESAEQDSFAQDLLKHAHYTRPRTFEGMEVPQVLLSGNHDAIAQWRLEASLVRTFLKRPDLLENRAFSEAESRILRQWCQRIERLIHG